MPDKGKILYVDDDERTLRVVSRFLREEGYLVVTTTFPFIAPLLKEENPDLIILDVDMPTLSGDRVLEVLRSHGFMADIPVIFYSGQTRPLLMKAVSQTGASGFVEKNAGLEALLEKIRSLLNAPG